MVKKYIRKGIKNAARLVKKRYFKGKGFGNPKLSTMYRDLSVLKSMVNAEKKRLEVNPTTTFQIGQVIGNGSGHYLLDLTPQPTQGTGYTNKTGNSFKWHSSYLDMQFSSQPSNISGQRLKIEIVKVVGQPFATVTDILNRYIEPTAFLSGGTVYDLHAPRDPDYFKNYKVIRRRYVKINPDSITGEMQVKRIKIGLKLKNHHVRTNDNDPTVTMGQVFLIITADQGNASPSTASTIVGIPTSAAATGVDLRYQFVHYFYDN